MIEYLDRFLLRTNRKLTPGDKKKTAVRAVSRSV